MIPFKKLIFLIQFLYFLPIFAGFNAGTLVRTVNGFVPIENIQKNNFVICIDDYNNMAVKPVLSVYKKSIRSHVRVYCDDICLMVSSDQLLYDARHNKWMVAGKLSVNDFLYAFDGRAYVVRHIEYDNEPTALYCLYIKDCHNFCVTSSGIIVHNFIPIVAGAVWAFGAGGIELVSLGIGFLGGTLIGYSQYKKHQRAKEDNVISVGSFGGGMFPGDPNDDDDELTQEEKKRQRDKARSEHRPLTNKEAREIARELGYKEVKDHPLGNTRGKPVFSNGKRYISPDADGHSGGHWKVFNSRGDILYTKDKMLIKSHRIY